jgi:hypothetical protein
MPAIPFASQAYSRPAYGLPPARLVNMYVEATPGGPAPTARLERPGLRVSYTVGAGPVWKVFRKAGAFDGDRFTASGSGIYREDALVGSVTSGVVRIDSSQSQLVVVDSLGRAFCYDGATFSLITDPDLPLVSDVAYVAGRFYYLEKDTDVWWFSAIDDATSIDGLAFATAESAPDANVGLAVLRDEVWFFGQDTVEPWYQTGDADAPLQRGQGRKFEKGCPAQESIVKLDNTLFFVGSGEAGFSVYRSADVPQRVSTHGVEDALSRCTDPSEITAYATGFDGHPQYVVNIPGAGSWAFDISTSEWAEWQSYGRDQFRGRTGLMVEGVALIGDDQTGTVWTLDKAVHQDGDDPITRIASAYLQRAGGKAPMSSLALMCRTGVGNSGQGLNPVVEMRYCDDENEGWSDWEAEPLGPIGAYSVRPRWTRLGLVESPGRLMEFRVTDPVSVVFHALVFNEAP